MTKCVTFSTVAKLVTLNSVQVIHVNDKLSSSKTWARVYFAPDNNTAGPMSNVVGCFRVKGGRDAIDMDEVFPRLYVGAADAAENQLAMVQHGISHIVTIMESPSPGNFHGIKYLRFRLADSLDADIHQYFSRCFRFIHRALKNPSSKVLVHCFMGVSRSVTLACSYLMRSNNISAQSALELIKRTRFAANPKPGFKQQLLDYEWELFFQQQDNQKKRLRLAILYTFPPSKRQYYLPILLAMLFL